MKKGILLLLAAGTLFTTLHAHDTGWYITRKSPYQANKELEERKTDIRDLVTDCAERSISLSCHRAGVWLMKHNEKQRGVEYLKNACKLGRGYSCRMVGLEYLHQLKESGLKGNVSKEELHEAKAVSKEAKHYFTIGCFRRDAKSCDYVHNLPTLPELKMSAMEKLDEVLGS